MNIDKIKYNKSNFRIAPNINISQQHSPLVTLNFLGPVMGLTNYNNNNNNERNNINDHNNNNIHLFNYQNPTGTSPASLSILNTLARAFNTTTSFLVSNIYLS